MGIDVDAVKSEITSLLSSYRREKGKIKKSTGTGKGREDIYISNWFAFKFFDFLSEKDTLNTEEIYAEENSQDNFQPSVDDASDQSKLQSEKQTTEQSIENVIEFPSQSNGKHTIAKRKIFVSKKK
ncbi:hypothetical protein JTB14_037548 [Gonioctena quinquepunctata]|nr:hypothetical protein JTB14_037548 [Gonioctena quinquepunctata]